jgi:lambda family phage portal protein
MLRGMAAGVGCSYESISRDFSQTNYSSSRLSLLEDRDHWRALQQFLIENLHQPVFEAWLEMAVLGGALNLPFYETDPERYRAIRWMPRGWAWVDPAKEVQAYKDAVRCGFKTLGEVVAEQGGDLEELLMARAAELAMTDDLDLTFDTDPHEVNASGTQQVGDMAEDQAEEMDPASDADPTDDNEEDNTEGTDGPIA